MQSSIRWAHLGLIGLMWAGMVGVTAIGLADGWGLATLIPAAGVLLLPALFAAARRGWPHAAPLTLAAAVLLAALGPPNTDLDAANSLALVLPAIVGLIIGRPWWIGGAAAASLALFAARSGGRSLAAADPAVFLLLTMAAGGLWVGRWVVERAVGAAERQSAERQAALERAEAQAAQLASANRRHEALIDEQRALIDLVASLETPVVQVAERGYLAPLVGRLDARRLEAVAGRLLALAHERRAELVVLDVSGAAALDAEAARGLLDVARAIRLMGCDVTLCGVGAGSAGAIVGLGVDLGGLRIVSTPHEAIRRGGGG